MQNFVTIHQTSLRDRGEIWAPAGHGRTSFVDLREGAEAAGRVLTEAGHEKRAYTLTGPQALSLDDIAASLSAVLGRPVTYAHPGIIAVLRYRRATRQPRATSRVMTGVHTGVHTAERFGLAAAAEPDSERSIGRNATPVAQCAARCAAVWHPVASSQTGRQ